MCTSGGTKWRTQSPLDLGVTLSSTEKHYRHRKETVAYTAAEKSSPAFELSHHVTEVTGSPIRQLNNHHEDATDTTPLVHGGLVGPDLTYTALTGRQ